MLQEAYPTLHNHGVDIGFLRALSLVEEMMGVGELSILALLTRKDCRPFRELHFLFIEIRFRNLLFFLKRAEGYLH